MSDLFGFADEPAVKQYDKKEIEFLAAYFSGRINASYLDGDARTLFEF
jgi:hypothetical protein